MDTPRTGDLDPILASDTYGKSRVRLMKLDRGDAQHRLKEVTFQILFRGDFASCYETGDNRQILPTDTIKNSVYALARKHKILAIEEFAQVLIRHFLDRNPQVREVRVGMVEHLWSPVARAAFTRESQQRTALVTGTRERVTVESGIDNLVILKSADSAFAGYIHDSFTTLKETSDRIFATAVRATWRYAASTADFNSRWEGIRRTIVDTFARHDSRSVQHTLHAVGQAVLRAFSDVAEIELAMPNLHALLVDLAPFGLDNPNEVFQPIDDPSGYIEAKLVRRQSG